jgi:hypothetical protein
VATLIALISHHSSIRLAEVGFVLILFAGLWYLVSEIPPLARLKGTRAIVLGFALALAGAMLIIATHWGKFS